MRHILNISWKSNNFVSEKLLIVAFNFDFNFQYYLCSKGYKRLCLRPLLDTGISSSNYAN